jgi:hypothetical protein
MNRPAPDFAEHQRQVDDLGRGQLLAEAFQQRVQDAGRSRQNRSRIVRGDEGHDRRGRRDRLVDPPRCPSSRRAEEEN